MKAKMNKSWRL